MALSDENPSQSSVITLSKKYMIFLILYMALYEFMDTYTTSYLSAVVSYIEADLHIDHSGFYIIQAIGVLGLFLVLFVQNLTDIVGRKPMMIIVFFGMGFAAVIKYLANGNRIVFTIGFLLGYIFFSSDLWLIVVAEEVKQNTRGRLTYLIAVIGALGAIAIPIARSIFITTTPEVDPTLWRGMNFIAMVAIPLALLGFWMKETTAFKLKRQSGEFKQIHQENRQKLRIPFQKEYQIQMLTFMIVGLLMGAATGATTTLESFLNTYIPQPATITIVMYAATIGTFIFFGITGFLADSIGRKRTLYVYFGILLITYLLLVFYVQNYLVFPSVWLLAISSLFANGSFWGMFMLTKSYCVECFPTFIRGTSSGWRSFSYALGLLLGSLLSSVFAVFLDLGWIYLIFIGIATLTLVPLISRNLPETKGISILTPSETS